MIQSTDSERAEFEALAVAEVFPISRCFDDDSLYEYTVTQRKWEDWQAARRAPSVPETIEQRAKKLKGLQVLIGATSGVPEAIELARSRFTEAYGRSPLHDDLAYACLLIDAYGGAPAAPVPQGLREAAQAVVERWDTPLWKDVPATTFYIANLRAALAAAHQPPDAFQTEGGLKSEIRTTKTVPQWYVGGVMTGNRVALEFESQENAETWFEKFCDDYDASATQSIDAEIKVSQNHFNESPVQMPEPVAEVIYLRGEMAAVFVDDVAPDAGTTLYTDQQVRQLLSNHGIKANK